MFDISRLDAVAIIKIGMDCGKNSLEAIEKIKNLVLDSCFSPEKSSQCDLERRIPWDHSCVLAHFMWVVLLCFVGACRTVP